MAATLCAGCTLIPFTDAVERDPEAPLSRAPAQDWTDCLLRAIDAQAQDHRRRRADDVAPGIIAACRTERFRVIELAEREHFKSLANGLEAWYGPRDIAAKLQMARAKREGILAIETPQWDGLMNGVSQAELESRLRQWDECADAAALFLAKGNPKDDPIDLAQRAAWDYCGVFGQDISHKFLLPFAPRSANAVGDLVPRHEVDRRPELAGLISKLQAQQVSY